MRSQTRSCARSLATLIGVASLIALFALTAQLQASAADEQNAAGLVIQYADGRIAYLYVEFSKPEITGAELLERSGLAHEIAPYGGLGVAVCSIDGEGCPSDDCFCESYGQEAYFWRYHRLSDEGEWIPLPVGPTARTLKNGDVDGWSWSAKDHRLPETSFEEITRLNNVAGDSLVVASPTAQSTELANVGNTGPARGMIVDPTTGIEPLRTANDGDEQADLNYVALAAGVGIVVVIGGWVVWQRRQTVHDG